MLSAFSARLAPAHRSAVALMLLVGAVFARPALAATATPTRTPTPTPTATATPVLVRLVLGPTSVKRQVGQFQNFTAIGYLSDGVTTVNMTQKVTYFTDDQTIAFPTNLDGNAGRVEAVGVGTTRVFAVDPKTGVNSNDTGDSATMEVVAAPTPTPTNTGVTPTRTKTPTPTVTATPKLVTLEIAPLSAKRNVGQTQNFSVKGTYSDGNVKNVTQAATYVSSNPSVVQCPNDTTTNKGTTLAVAPGVATISASFAGLTTTATGGDAEFTVVVAPTPTATHTGATPTRTVSPTPTTTATPVLVSIALGPSSTKKGIGGFQNFTATATFSDGSTKNFTQRMTYASSDTSVAVAPNDPTVGKSRVNAVGVGTAVISAVDADTGMTTDASGGNATFDVVLAPTPTPTNTGVTPTRTKTPTPTPTSTPVLVSLAMSPLTVKKAAGQFQNFIVNGTYSNGDVKNLTQKVDYISSKPDVASAPNDPTIGKSRVLAVAPGVAIISAKDPATGVTTAPDESATFTVTQAPSPTPTHTGPTSTGPTGTPSPKATPTATATPILTKIDVNPKTTEKAIGSPKSFSALGTFSDGSTKNVTSKLHYVSSDPTIASVSTDPTTPSKVTPLKVGTVTISAFDPATNVSSTDSGGDATLTVVAGSGSPQPHATATPSLPDQSGGSPTTTCQRDVRRAARTFVDKKLKALEKCGGAASACVQRKPNDPKCLPSVRVRCAAVLGKLTDAETRFVATVIKRCAGLAAADLLGGDGLAYDDIATSCSARYGRALSDLTSVAQCLVAEHSCRAETLFALERPRAGELLRLAEVAPDAAACREDFGGSGVGLNDPKGAGKALERCTQTVVRGGERYAEARLGSIGRCVDTAFVCVETLPGDAACLAKATQKCDREFARAASEVAKLTIAVGKKCGTLDFATLGAPSGANLDAIAPSCPGYGIPEVGSMADYVACLVRQHDCDVADLVRFESPRADEVLTAVGRAIVDATCPPP